MAGSWQVNIETTHPAGNIKYPGMCVVGDDIYMFGGHDAEIFYESADLTAEAKILYGWVKDQGGRINDHGKQALYLQLTELP
jgi:hypothetical protein